jgi:hypothetical protein
MLGPRKNMFPWELSLSVRVEHAAQIPVNLIQNDGQLKNAFANLYVRNCMFMNGEVTDVFCARGYRDTNRAHMSHTIVNVRVV